MFEKIKNWFLRKMNEFILFLEYPLDYIVEFGDELRTLDTAGRVIKVGKVLVSAYICVQIIMVLLFAVLLIAFFGGGSNSLANSMYTDALQSSLADMDPSSSEAADVRQELHNHGIDV